MQKFKRESEDTICMRKQKLFSDLKEEWTLRLKHRCIIIKRDINYIL